MAPQTFPIVSAPRVLPVDGAAAAAVNHPPSRLSKELPVLWYAQQNERSALILDAWSFFFPEDPLLDFSNGSELLHFLWNPVALKPRVVILDVDAPEPSGVYILEAIRANPALSHLPVALLGECSHPDDREKVHALGADWCFVAPRDAEQARLFVQAAFECFQKPGFKHTASAFAA